MRFREMNDRGGDSFPIIGGSSLLVIFSVLCLTVFALLCMSTVQADGRLTDASIKSVEAYYEADAEAEAVFAALRGGKLPEGVTVSGMEYSYECPVGETQKLVVSVEQTMDGWKVLRWNTVMNTEWQPDETIKVWDGTLPN